MITCNSRKACKKKKSSLHCINMIAYHYICSSYLKIVMHGTAKELDFLGDKKKLILQQRLKRIKKRKTRDFLCLDIHQRYYNDKETI